MDTEQPNPLSSPDFGSRALTSIWKEGLLIVPPEVLLESLLNTDSRLITTIVCPLLEKDPRTLASHISMLRTSTINENITSKEWPGYAILALRLIAASPIERRLVDLKEFDKEIQEVLAKDEYLQEKHNVYFEILTKTYLESVMLDGVG